MIGKQESTTKSSPLSTTKLSTTKSKSSAVPVANRGRSPGIIRQPTSTRVQTAVADSTSVISARSSTSTGKRKSAEEERNELKKRKLEKKEVNDRHKHRDTHDRLKNRDLHDRLKNRETHDRLKHKDTPAVKPLMDFVIPRRTGLMYYRASTTLILYLSNFVFVLLMAFNC